MTLPAQRKHTAFRSGAALQAGVDALEHCSCLTETGVLVTDELLETLAARRLPVGPRSALHRDLSADINRLGQVRAVFLNGRPVR